MRPRGPRLNGRGRYVGPPGDHTQRVTVKTHIHRLGSSGHRSSKAAVAHHLAYLQRDGVEPGQAPGILYSRELTGLEATPFVERGAQDRHHYRVIVSPERGADLDLTRFTRDLMAQVEQDTGTALDWVAVNHYNTAHPHTHVMLRGVDEDGRGLYLTSDYMNRGMAYRARELATLELGLRREREPAWAYELER
jgi:type IV secretory pathway VirD2 relaxase